MNRDNLSSERLRRREAEQANNARERLGTVEQCVRNLFQTVLGRTLTVKEFQQIVNRVDGVLREQSYVPEEQPITDVASGPEQSVTDQKQTTEAEVSNIEQIRAQVNDAFIREKEGGSLEQEAA